MDCGNLLKVKNRAFLPASLTHIDAATLADIDFNKNEDIWEMADALKERADLGLPYTKMEMSRSFVEYRSSIDPSTDRSLP